ncbi:MAG TPA: DeoR/GlpR family DNA-binding transcription regulator [Tepidisphaeraceae bacterium]|nr:DeoR/GlpR family DNA-binding transcription regulator [Tepidisphaeraceae bacterium]
MRQATRERQARVLSELLDKKHVTVRDLATNMDVSEATVRRDLKALADGQKVHLFHGGAVLPSEAYFSFGAKRDRNQAAKHVIGQLAASLVNDGEQILLDSGTTIFEMAEPLSSKRGLSVILNSARLALELKGQSMNLIMLGGQYRPDRMDTIGPIAMSTLDQLRGYTAFLGADGVSMNFGVSAADIESAHLYRLAVTNARETVLLVDHTKFESASLFKIVDWDVIHRIVTDERPTDDWMQFFNTRNIKVIYPQTNILNV